MTKFFTTLVFLLSATAMYAYDYVLEGQVSNKYDVTVYLDVNFNTGKVTGKYCYKSTIKNKGKSPRPIFICPELLIPKPIKFSCELPTIKVPTLSRGVE